MSRRNLLAARRNGGILTGKTANGREWRIFVPAAKETVGVNQSRRKPYYAVPRLGYLPVIMDNVITLSVRYSRAKAAVEKLGKYKYSLVHADNLDSVLGEFLS